MKWISSSQNKEMANKYEKEMFIVLSHQGNTNQTTLRFMPSQSEWLSCKERERHRERESMREREHISTCWWGCGTLYIAGENVSSLSAMEISMQSCQKPEVVLPYNNDIVMPFLDMYLKDSKSSCHIESYILCFNNIHKKQAMLSANRSENKWMGKKCGGVYIH